ncbi:MAG: radical SAM protein, partial [Syntrophorhabdaceae bacterium]|nr:radical SAM protein [Syntrophorhabdaceae bacterium]
NRFTVYGRTRSAVKKGLDEMKAFRAAGLDRIHFGIESGNDRVLEFMKKGVTGEEHIITCQKTKDAGISASVYVMPGLGGARWSQEHALDTARVLTEARADYIRLRSLEIFPRTGLAEAAAKGEFEEATEEQVVQEIRTLVENIKTDTTIVSDSASNLLDVSGSLPADRDKMLKVIDEYLALSPKGKLAFSLSSRLRSFMGQYGGLTQDIVAALQPYIQGDQINVSTASEEEIQTIIRLIRSKLMP